MKQVIATFEGNKSMQEVFFKEGVGIVGAVETRPLKINWDNAIYGFDVQWMPKKKHNPLFDDIKS